MDANAHAHMWDQRKDEDARGRDLADFITASSMVPLNDPTTPTRKHYSPDVTLASSSIALGCTWQAVDTMCSDHRALNITIKQQFEPLTSTQRRTYLNLSKANWPAYTADIEHALSTERIRETVHKEAKFLTSVIKNASGRHIPSGLIKNYVPQLSETARRIMKEHEELGKKAATRANTTQRKTLSDELAEEINRCKREKWIEHVEKAATDPHKAQLWKLLKKLDGRSAPEARNAIKFNGKSTFKPDRCATLFNDMFASAAGHVAKDPDSRSLLRHIRALPLADAPTFDDLDIRIAIDRLKPSKAAGPDGLTPVHLRHLGPAGRQRLANLLSWTLRTNTIPAMWKRAHVIPLLKAGKPADVCSSYRPIALLSPFAKILERLLLRTIVEAAPPAAHQHGFRTGHSTTSALVNIVADATEGLNKPRTTVRGKTTGADRTVMVALDLSKAFDTVRIDKLLSIYHKAQLQPAALRFLSNYLRGRETRTIFRDVISRARQVRAGVPQGSILSPALFNGYLRDLPEPPAGVTLTSYADDVTITARGPVCYTIGRRLTPYVQKLSDFFNSRGLQVSAAKSSVSLLTKDTSEHNVYPGVKIDGEWLPHNKHPKILGLTFDPLLTFAKHTNNIANTGRKRLNVLKMVSGTTWGPNKETLKATYKGYIGPVLEYAAQAWSTCAAPSNVVKLQRIQSAAERIMTGCHAGTRLQHLSDETRILPVQRRSTCFPASGQHAARTRFTRTMASSTAPLAPELSTRWPQDTDTRSRRSEEKTQTLYPET